MLVRLDFYVPSRAFRELKDAKSSKLLAVDRAGQAAEAELPERDVGPVRDAGEGRTDGRKAALEDGR